MEKPAQPSPDVLIGLNRSATIARLLSGTVHDVNNALQVIAGSLELIEGRTDLPDAVVRALARMRNQSTRAAEALDRVTSFTRAPLDERTVVDLRELVGACVALREFAIKRARLAIDVEAPGEGSRAVMGTRALLDQAVLNLIMNAEQSSADQEGTIRIRLVRDAGWVAVEVSDTGRGLLPEGGTIVAPLARADPSEATALLGLWAAQRIAEEHGGALTWAAGDPGATFTMRLPAIG